MIKNCFTGDMARPTDISSLFFQATPPSKDGASYCYNSLFLLEGRTTQGALKLHVLREAKGKELRAYNFSISADEIQKSKQDTPLLTLNGLKGTCFSPDGKRETCDGGLLRTIGLKDVDMPVVVALGRASHGAYVLSHIAIKPEEVRSQAAKALDPANDQDAGKLLPTLLQEVRHKLVQAAKSKMASMRTPGITPQKLADTSEQFRYCNMALEGFLKEKNMSSPLQTDEKLTVATVTNYLNNEPPPNTAAPVRMPASTTAAAKHKR